MGLGIVLSVYYQNTSIAMRNERQDTETHNKKIARSVERMLRCVSTEQPLHD